MVSGVQQFESETVGQENPLGNVARLLGQLGREEDNDRVVARSQELIPIGTGLAALPKKLVDKIQANEYIDFNKLPPAKGRSKGLPQMLEGQVILIQSADLVQSRKMIPDLATWLQCYSLYVAVMAAKHPERTTELMAYQSQITRSSTRYRWPTWLIYDQNFRQEAANNPSQSWTRVDPTSLCLFGLAFRPFSLAHDLHNMFVWAIPSLPTLYYIKLKSHLSVHLHSFLVRLLTLPSLHRSTPDLLEMKIMSSGNCKFISKSL